jgi:L-threonylcarbamoyladenylate synthase
VIDVAVRALRTGEPVVLATDTVYGLCSRLDEDAVMRMYALKGRLPDQPTAVLFASVRDALTAAPALSRRVADALLPGPFTLVVPNPERRFRYVTGSRPDTLGVRVPALTGSAALVLRKAGPLVATSANLAGGRAPRRIGDVPFEIQDGCGAVLDSGELPGLASTIVDLTGPEPRVLREGAVGADTALALVRAAQ